MSQQSFKPKAWRCMQCLEQCRERRSGCDALARHAGVDLHMHREGAMRQLALHRFLLEQCDLVRLPHNRREGMVEAGRGFVLPQAAHDQNARPIDNAGGPQRFADGNALLDRGYAKPARTGVREHGRAFGGAVPVCIRLHHGQHIHLWPGGGAQPAIVGTQGAGGNLGPDWARVLDRNRTHRCLCY